MQPSSSGGFVGNIAGNLKTESCKAIELRNRVVPSKPKVGGQREEASEGAKNTEEKVRVEKEVNKKLVGEKSEEK